MKRTKQKEIILDAVFELNHHPTADEIYLYLKKDYPRLSLASVDRNLNTYAQDGKIRKVSIPGDSERFDFNLSEHEHFYCESCHQVYDVKVNISEVINNVSPFVLSSYKLMLYGTCEACKNHKN